MTVPGWEERVELAQRFAPRLVLYPEEQSLGRPRIEGGAGDYHPRSLELLLQHGRLFPGTIRAARQLKFKWLFSHASRIRATPDNLAKSHHVFDQIRLLGGPIPNPNQAWAAYFNILDSVDAQGRSGYDRFPLTAYVHVITRAEAEQACRASTKINRQDYAGKAGRPFYQPDWRVQPDDVALQYWFCYYFDDWANIHEGDWESITLFLRRENGGWLPLGATYSAHENGTRRHWKDIEHLADTHPVVYVASGSHAAYFQHVPEGHTTELAGIFLGKLKFKIGLSTSHRDFVPPPGVQHPPLIPHVEVLPDPVDVISADNLARRHLKWMNFKGSWGARELGHLIAGGPVGPSQKGLKWLNPFAWSESECWPDYLVY
jgi:hypothetical protein